MLGSVRPKVWCRACRNEVIKKHQGRHCLWLTVLVNYEAQHAMTTLHSTLILSGKVLRHKSWKRPVKIKNFVSAAGFKLVYLLLAKYWFMVTYEFWKPSVTFVRKGILSIKYVQYRKLPTIWKIPFESGLWRVFKGETIMRSASVRIFRDK
jgi:hypothetical protein